MQKGLDKNIELIRKMFFDDLKPLREIAEAFGVSAMAIQKVLKRHGYDTSKAGLNLPVTCKYCEKKFTRTRARVREAVDIFCSNDCYWTYVKILNENNVIDRYGQRISRNVMEKFYGPLPDGSVVHHIDGDDTNIHITNLMLLKSQADHVMIHRNYGKPEILFDGRKIDFELQPNQYLDMRSGSGVLLKGPVLCYDLSESISIALDILAQRSDLSLVRMRMYELINEFNPNRGLSDLHVAKSIPEFDILTVSKNKDGRIYYGGNYQVQLDEPWNTSHGFQENPYADKCCLLCGLSPSEHQIC